jgi:hypothetical protein
MTLDLAANDPYQESSTPKLDWQLETSQVAWKRLRRYLIKQPNREIAGMAAVQKDPGGGA